MNRLSEKFGKKGFTLVELTVVLVIIGILAAVGIPTAIHFIRQAEYRKNEENAKTAYLAAESTLTWYRTSGEWETFREQVKAKGILNDTFPAGDVKEGRIYAVSVNRWDSGESASRDLALELLDGGVYSKDFFDAEIVIEVDVESGQVYSAFYGTRCGSLTYGEPAPDGTQCISADGSWREPAVRREAALGYYSVEDVANVVELKKVRLKVTTINLINSETLSLNWTSNSRNDNLDVNYQITFYRKDSAGDEKLFTTEVELGELRGQGQMKTGTAQLELKNPAGNSLGIWRFPLTYQRTEGQSGRFSLVLDGMMTAELSEVVNGNRTTALQSVSTGITRLGEKIPALQLPQDIYAEIQAQPAYRVITGEDGKEIAMSITEYKMGSPVRSNIENTLYANMAWKDSVLEAEITRFRHLSNIRYYAPDQSAVFILASRNLDWTSAGVGMYGLSQSGTEAEGVPDGLGTVKWQSAAAEGQVLDFPSIPLLSQNHRLEGKTGMSVRISNLRLGAGSMPEDSQIKKLYGMASDEKLTRYLGLFCEAEGKIRNLTLADPVLRLTGGESADGSGETILPAPAEQFGALYGVGILCGRCAGSLENIAVQTTSQEHQTVLVSLPDRPGETDATGKTAGIGALAGVLAGKNTDGSLAKLTDTAVILSGLTTEGVVTGRLPDPDGGAAADGSSTADPEGGAAAGTDTAAAGTTAAEARALDYRYGIGGMFGYAWIGSADPDGAGVQLTACVNRADVNGNLFTGGIVGTLKSDFRTGGNPNLVNVKDSRNEGLVLCLVNHEEEADRLEGRFFGGIAGYGDGAQISRSVNASAYRGTYEYAQKEELLRGHDVGGILGYGNNSQLSGCSTGKGSYVFGSHYVGGIAGGLSNQLQEAITGAGSLGVQVTTNAGYVIGERYVGGIVGKNDGSEITTISDCINNGVAAGYDRYVGGIVGYNGTNGVIKDCASYFSDYSGSVLQTIVEKWHAAGDCTGGLAGYNNGKITFSKDNESIQVKSVSGIVVGGNYVGGIVGFNDAGGTLAVEQYALIGGQIHGANAVGGCIGLNASAAVLEQGRFAVRPAGVTGNFYVGGCIGANVVDLADETTMTGIRTDSPLGSVTGNAFTGGVIGYHRTYDGSRLSAGTASDDGTVGEDAKRLLLSYMEKVEDADKARKGTAGGLLPVLGEDNVPEPVVVSENQQLLIIGNVANNEDGKQTEYNNTPVSADLYVGGIVGYCEKNSRLHIVNSRNSGKLSRCSKTGSGEYVSLKAYLKSAEVDAEAEDLEGEELKVSIGGGVIGANLEHQIIDHCANEGTMNGFVGLGGIVGFNAGGVFNCELSHNFGSPGLDYIGGIAGLNVHTGSTENPADSYKDVMGTEWAGPVSGTVAKCRTAAGIRISGRRCVGGVVGFNLSDAQMKSNENHADVSGSGSYVGGMAGANSGKILLSDSSGNESAYTVAGSGEGTGGVVGHNRSGGSVDITGASGASREIVAVNGQVSVTGREKVGGVIGVNEGKLEVSGGVLVSQAKIVSATHGYAGGVIGEARIKTGDTAGDARITGAVNRSLQVTADRGPAGGIVAVNREGFEIRNCTNLGNVKSDNGYAGGIAAENYGWIIECKVGAGGATVTVSSERADDEEAGAIGAVCAVNHGCLWQSAPEASVILSGTARIVGGIAGINAPGGQIGIPSETGNSRIYDVNYMPRVDIETSSLTVGGVAGQNRQGAVIRNLTVKGSSFENFHNYQYLGGVTGDNQDGALAEDCLFQDGKITQKSGTAAGNCYGGIAGRNDGRLQGCKIDGIVVNVQGVYTATSTSTAAEKEALASHVGGIAGKNEANGVVAGCLITGQSSSITVENGMAGGIAGYNKNQITLSGDAVTDTLMQKNIGEDGSVSAGVKDVQSLIGNAASKGIAADENYVNWKTNISNAKIEDVTQNRQQLNRQQSELETEKQIKLEEQVYANTQEKVGENRALFLLMSNNGNLGGITAYNAPEGQVSYCATGNWYLNNKSEAIGAGTGGIIGMNESEKNQEFLLNQAFVGRQVSPEIESTTADDKKYKEIVGKTDRFAGGIIGNQNNITGSGWTIRNCVNYGTVYGRYTHYSGGIIGQWTGTGGNIEKCHNFGNLQTTYAKGWVGASGGIVAQLYHAYENNEYNITGCGNYGNIYGRTGRSIKDCANDSAGILGNVTAYTVDKTASAQKFTINVTDCVNGPGVEVYSESMASGIVGFLSCSENPGNSTILNSTANIALHIKRCRNYASTLSGRQFVAGIFGDRYGETGAHKTTIKHCFSLDYSKYDTGLYGTAQPYPIVSCRNANARPDLFNEGDKEIYNFFLSDRKEIGSFSGSGDTLNNNTFSNGSTLLRVNAGWVYSFIKNDTRYFVYLTSTGNYSVNNINIDGEKVRYSSQWSNNEIGRVLFTIKGADADTYENMASVVAKGSNFDQYVREFCFKEADMLLAPEKAILSKADDGTFRLEVDAPAYADTKEIEYVAELYRTADDGTVSRISVSEMRSPSEGITVSADVDNFRFSSENCNFGLSDVEIAKGGDLFVRVKVRKTDGSAESSEVESNRVPIGAVLPDPKLRIELIPGQTAGTGGTGYQYRFRLANQTAYAGYSNLMVHVKLMDGNTLEFAPNVTANYDKLTANSLQQLVVWVEENTAQGSGASSAEVSVPVYLPRYTPEIDVKKTAPSCTVTGTSLKDLTVMVTLTGPGGSVVTPPVYRAELVGADTNGNVGKDKVFRTADVLTVANGSVSAVFGGFSDEEEVKELIEADVRVRVWYAQSGLGPVYTYYMEDLLTGETANTRTRETAGGDWQDAYTHVLSDDIFEDYRWISGKLFEWLEAPVLMTVPDGQSLTPTVNSEGCLTYTFTWDQGKSPENNDYLVNLTGVTTDADGNESNPITIVTDRAVKGGKLTLDAEDWPYEKVTLSVTRKGYTQSAGTTQTIYIGKTSSGTYSVKKRLPRPEQPQVTNPDVNELQYEIEWSPVTPEAGSDTGSGCTSYEVYIRPVTPDASIPKEIRETVQVREDGKPNITAEGIYRRLIDLEPYAGRRVLISVRALASDDDAVYVRSVDGVTYELSVPERIDAPKIAVWAKNWKHERYRPDQTPSGDPLPQDETKSIEAFEGGGADGLKVTLTADSLPPGGSSYLLKAYVFDTEEAAEAAQKALTNGTGVDMDTVAAYYPMLNADEKLIPAGMEPEGVSQNQFSHTLAGLSAEYAGKYILFSARISSGDGKVSSPWAVQSGGNNPDPFIWRLPYVKLPTPEVTVETGERPVTMRFSANPDLGQGSSLSANTGASAPGGGSAADASAGAGGTDLPPGGDSAAGASAAGADTASAPGGGSAAGEPSEAADTASAPNGASADTTAPNGSSAADASSGDAGTASPAGDRAAGVPSGIADKAAPGGASAADADKASSRGDRTAGVSAGAAGKASPGENPAADMPSADADTASSAGDYPVDTPSPTADRATGRPLRTDAEGASLVGSAMRLPMAGGASGLQTVSSTAVLQTVDSAIVPETEASVPSSQDGEGASDPQEDEGGIVPQADVGPVEEAWMAENTVLTWSSVEYADAYYFTLTDADGMDDGRERTADFRIVERKNEDDPSASTAEVYGKGTDDKWVKIEATESNPGDAFVYDLSRADGGFAPYGKTVKGFYAIHQSATSIAYEAGLSTSLAITLEDDGTFTYRLTMPDSNSLTPPEDGAYGSSPLVNGEDNPLRFTDSVRIWSDMEQNEDPDPNNWSEAYVKSVEHVAEFNN